MPPRPSLWRISYLPILRLAGAIMWGRPPGLQPASRPACPFDRRAGPEGPAQTLRSAPQSALEPSFAPPTPRGLRDEVLLADQRLIAGQLQHILLDDIFEQSGPGPVARRYACALI